MVWNSLHSEFQASGAVILNRYASVPANIVNNTGW
jgi:hypothetical protein